MHLPVWLHEALAVGVTLVVALVWLRSLDALALRGMIHQNLSRKLVHIGTGPLFVLCWNIFPAVTASRWLAALVPLMITLHLVMVARGVVQDPGVVHAMSRTGDRAEILRGPLYYGLVFVVTTIVFWRDSPVGILALMMMCGGDGLADIVGRRWGHARLAWSKRKSWAGSAAMFAGSFVFAGLALLAFNQIGRFSPALEPSQTTSAIALIALVATVVESLPFADVDNVTVMLSAIATAWLLIGPLGMWPVKFIVGLP
ncbi:MAG: phosphatidate cytidylyltransferase [Chloroflexi bacterium RBG_19FT_COMBO_62_14]|nr:MAG: phosphatidate cytidylyltransferase [Chloroflexi bacterium RBG_19FT_COMBO_62_14]